MSALPFIIFMAIIFSVPLLAILTEHRRKVLQMKLNARSAPDAEIIEKLQDLTKQLADLRATTTEYDLSFDTALQRIESRIEHLERRVQALERQSGGPREEISQELR